MSRRILASFSTKAKSTLKDQWKNVPMGPVDPILGVTTAFNNDPSEEKINVGVGAYRTEEGKPWVLPSVKAAEEKFASAQHNLEYLPIQGYDEFIRHAMSLLYGSSCVALKERRVAASQSPLPRFLLPHTGNSARSISTSSGKSVKSGRSMTTPSKQTYPSQIVGNGNEMGIGIGIGMTNAGFQQSPSRSNITSSNHSNLSQYTFAPEYSSQRPPIHPQSVQHSHQHFHQSPHPHTSSHTYQTPYRSPAHINVYHTYQGQQGQQNGPLYSLSPSASSASSSSLNVGMGAGPYPSTEVSGNEDQITSQRIDELLQPISLTRQLSSNRLLRPVSSSTQLRQHFAQQAHLQAQLQAQQHNKKDRNEQKDRKEH